jgi:hypothetical protein
MLESLTLATFADRIGEPFLIYASADHTLELALVEARSLASDGTRAEGSRRAREPFSIVFKGPAAPVMPQSIYALAHDSLGSLELFLVPIGPDRDGMLYQAIFT